MIKCPSCGKDFESAPMKKWKFRFYDVERFKCPNCGKGIMVYSALGKRTWTIPKPKS